MAVGQPWLGSNRERSKLYVPSLRLSVRVLGLVCPQRRTYPGSAQVRNSHLRKKKEMDGRHQKEDADSGKEVGVLLLVSTLL